MNLNKAIETFNDGNFDRYLKPIFNNARSFLTIVLNKGRKDEIDIENLSYKDYESDSELFSFLYESGFFDNVNYNNIPEEIKNSYLLYQIGNDPATTLNYICDNILSDVVVRSDGFWLLLSDREELSIFFDDRGRDTTAKDVAKSALSEEGLDYDRWWGDTTDDIYRDVIDELNEENLIRLSEYVLKYIGDQDLSVEDYGSDFFHDLAKEQDREGFFRITSNDVNSLIKDQESMEELMNGPLDELKGELYSIHSNAYNSAYESEIYELVYGGLKEYFSSNITEESKKNGEKVRYQSFIKISDFQSNVESFLNEYRYGGYYETLDYFGGYREMMNQLFSDDVYEEIDFRIPDYPDYQLVDKYINEFFGDYI